MTSLRIGTRASPLALWQAQHISDRLRPWTEPRSVELVHIETTGDRDRTASLAQIGGQGVFTKEIQRALLDRRVDLAVHSLKDLPTTATPGLRLAAIPSRGPVEDVLVSKTHAGFDALPTGARVATGSVRRRAQLLARRPDLQPVDIRGNVDTRLRKLDEGEFDALLLARAGLERLGRATAITEVLAWMLPAVGQGALALECRSDDAETIALAQHLDDADTRAAVAAERTVLAILGGGCQVPLGALATVVDGTLRLRAVLASADGSQMRSEEISGAVSDAVRLGAEVGQRLHNTAV